MMFQEFLIHGFQVCPLYFINKNQSQVRQRFSIAHELGHLLLHASSGSQLEASIHLDKHTFYRNPLSSKGIDEQEKEANRFAAELLMPSVYLKEKIASCPDMIDCNEDIVSTIAKELKVSTTALSLKLAGIIKGMGL
jgi:Zn-dependent peptidase ImmA (M78 family)